MKGAQLEIAGTKGDGEVFGLSSLSQVILQVLGNVPTMQASRMVSNTPTQTDNSHFPEQVLLLERLLKDTALKTISAL